MNMSIMVMYSSRQRLYLYNLKDPSDITLSDCRTELDIPERLSHKVHRVGH